MALVAARPTPTGAALATVTLPGLAVKQMTPECALAELNVGDVAVGRLDVRRTLDGVDDGLWVLGALEARGVSVLNSAAALLASHDKLLTARLLGSAGIPHPTTQVVRGDGKIRIGPPVVVKPRFGSWGEDVHRCDDEEGVARALDAVAGKEWFASRGALVQELVPPVGYDVRVLIASGRCVGAISRVAAAGEWRTNVALGARRVRLDPPGEAVALAVATAETLGTSLVGVDLLPHNGGWVVLEANGAVEFNRTYASGRDVFRETVLGLTAAASRPARSTFGAGRRGVVDHGVAH